MHFHFLVKHSCGPHSMSWTVGLNSSSLARSVAWYSYEEGTLWQRDVLQVLMFFPISGPEHMSVELAQLSKK